MTQSGKLKFSNAEDDYEIGNAGGNVTRLDNDLIIKNIQKPYLFITLKHYKDKPIISDKP